MNKINSEIKTFFEERFIWVFTTCADKPNSAPCGVKKINEQGNLVIFDVFMKKGLENLEKNNLVAVTAYDEKTLEGYQIKGSATYSTDKDIISEGNALAEKFGLVTKGAFIVEVQEIFVQTPGPNAGKLL